MAYKQDIKEYKQKAQADFEKHLMELEDNVIKAIDAESNKNPVSKIYLDYQTSSLKLIEGKIKIDNEILKQINITHLEKYKDLEPVQFTQIQDKLVANHKQIIGELKASYETIANESREQLKDRLAKETENNDLDFKIDDPEEFFPDKMSVLSINFTVILILLILIIGLIYYYTFC